MSISRHLVRAVTVARPAHVALTDTLRSAGVSMRRGRPPAHPASTEQIQELRDQGLTWNEVAKQVDMTISGAWSRYRKT